MSPLRSNTTKSSAGQDRPTALADLSFAGVVEFARQWLLLSRWGDSASGTGRHDLVATIGGSAGHSSEWRVRIDEGSTGAKNRKWGVNLTPAGNRKWGVNLTPAVAKSGVA